MARKKSFADIQKQTSSMLTRLGYKYQQLPDGTYGYVASTPNNTARGKRLSSIFETYRNNLFNTPAIKKSEDLDKEYNRLYAQVEAAKERGDDDLAETLSVKLDEIDKKSDAIWAKARLQKFSRSTYAGIAG